MCLIIFKWQPSSDEPLILLGNRDEFYQRPSREAHHWEDQSNVIAGRVLQAGGTWLAMSKDLRLCTVTNFREVPARTGEHSRGEIPVEFLRSGCSASEYAAHLASQQDRYPGFNALIYDGESLVYSTNRSSKPVHTLEPGIYGLSNHLLDTPWPKVERAKQNAARILRTKDSDSDERNQALLAIMMDQTKPEDDALPSTGIGLDGERLLSSIFIQSEHYGTRTTSLVCVKKDHMLLTERNYTYSKQLAKPTFTEQVIGTSLNTWKD